MTICGKKDWDFLSENLKDLLKKISVERSVNKETFLFQEDIEANELYLIQSGIIQ